MITIDKEFQSLIPSLTAEEYAQLEENIKREGCRDALVVWNGVIIDGHNRYKICEKHKIPYRTVEREFESRESAMLWIIDNQLGRRNLQTYDRGVLALKKKDILSKIAREKKLSTLKQNAVNQKSDERREFNVAKELAKIAGISHDTMHKIETIEQKASEEIKQKLKTGDISINQAYIQVKKEQKKYKIIEKGKAEQTPINAKVIHGDFYTCTEIQDNSIDLILTDPPYPAEFLTLWSKLGEFAGRVLKPSGFLVAYSGQLHLNEVFASLNKYLIYYWTFALTHSGNRQLIMPRNVFCGWKPLLVFQKAPFKRLENKLDDVIKGTGREKDLHDWAQAEDELTYIINNFTQPGDMILDPFAGSGTTLIASLKNNRKCIGIEIDEINVNIIKGRIANEK